MYTKRVRRAASELSVRVWHPQAARKPKCGVLSFIAEFEELSRACEGIFRLGSRRADLERWYLTLATAMLQQIQAADHPRTPKALIHTGKTRSSVLGRRTDDGRDRVSCRTVLAAVLGSFRRRVTPYCVRVRRELPPAARRAVVAARGRAGGGAARVQGALRGRAAELRHSLLRPPAREAHALLRGTAATLPLARSCVALGSDANGVFMHTLGISKSNHNKTVTNMFIK